MEVYDVRSIDQRRDLVAVMEELSDFNFMLGRPGIQEIEVEAALNELPNVTIAPAPVALIGPGFLHAFGMRGGIEFVGADDDEASWWAEKLCCDMGIDPGDDAMVSLNRWMVRQLVTGPEDHHDPELRSFGYTLDVWRNMLEQRAEQERYLARKLDEDPKLRRGRLRDVVNAREMNIELGEVLAKMTTVMHTSIGSLLGLDVLSDQESRTRVRDFTDRMPSTRVVTSVKERYHRDGRQEWTTNDIQDIDALAIAVPYCDAVFADGAARTSVEQAKELRVFETCLPRSPRQLAKWLDDLPAS